MVLLSVSAVDSGAVMSWWCGGVDSGAVLSWAQQKFSIRSTYRCLTVGYRTRHSWYDCSSGGRITRPGSFRRFVLQCSRTSRP